MRWMLLPHTRSQGFQIVLDHFHDGPLIAGAPPVVAVDAADQHLTVVVDLHGGEPQVGQTLLLTIFKSSQAHL
jgi:hypothetical protein